MAHAKPRSISLLDAAQVGLAAGALLQIAHLRELGLVATSTPLPMFALYVGFQLAKLPLALVAGALILRGGNDLWG